jgi:hypothetical protein
MGRPRGLSGRYGEGKLLPVLGTESGLLGRSTLSLVTIPNEITRTLVKNAVKILA